jgi:hypothetical protein
MRGGNYHLPRALRRWPGLAPLGLLRDADPTRGGPPADATADPSGHPPDRRHAGGPQAEPGDRGLSEEDPAQRGLEYSVWLPYWSGTAEGGNQFYISTNDDEQVAHAYPTFTTIPASKVDEVLAPPPGSIAASIPAGAPDAAEEAPEDEPDFRAKTSGSGDEYSQEWRAWREEALEKLDLGAIYSEWLTGVQRPGWPECRDPINTKTGDKDASASVADGTSQAKYRAERGDFYSFHTSECISVFDFLVALGRAPNFIEAARIVAEALGVPLPRFDPEVEDTGVEDSAVTGKPVIQVNNRQPIDVIADTWAALTAENHRPTLFRRSTDIVRIKKTDYGDVHIAALGADDMAGMLYRVARWVKVKSRPGRTAKGGNARSKGRRIDVTPPAYLARDMLNFPGGTLPILEAIVRSPMFGASGRLIAINGYYPEDRLALIMDADLVMPTVPEQPSAADLAAARSLLVDDLFGDFQFKGESDRAHAVAAIVLPYVRQLIPGPTPLYVVESPCPGSGKGLLCSTITLVGTGEDCDARVLSQYDDEIRKMITAELSRAKPIILLDNVSTDGGRKLDSSSLASALTTTVSTDRVLQETRMADLPNQAV